ncbi:coiled-coil domain-containing protein 170 [Antennarius striatus]|uniref:coiled-coil domain-containing protein 170 n=1 Tax=Antennarius striatus TaxID=241820 RepID=UPI0035B29DB7
MEVVEKSECDEVVDQSNETVRLKMRIGVLEEKVKSCELDCKAERETVLRLVADLDRERRKAASSAEALSSVQMELDGLVVGRRSVEMERETLAERLEAGRRVMEASRRESVCLEAQVEQLERRLQASQAETRAAKEKLQTFLEKMEGLLRGRAQDVAPPTEKEVLHRVEKSFSEMEARLGRVSGELKEQMELQHGADMRAQLAEQQVQNLRERLQGLEAELMTADTRVDGLRLNEQQYEDFLERLSAALKVDSMALDLGFDMRMKLILSRGEQLLKQEATALVESKSQAYSLQRKVKIQKDQLESKDLHVQLLRKKVSDLEEEKRSRTALASERDDAHAEARRLQKRLERLQGDLRASRTSNAELKAQLSHASELKLKAGEQTQSLQEQKRRIRQLEGRKAEAEARLNAATSDLQSQEERSRGERQQLHALRDSLAQLSERERELVDFRMVVSQMLGLDAAALARPNYDIIQELESLLHHHHHHHHHQHHLLHHVNAPWHCPAHHRPHLPDDAPPS